MVQELNDEANKDDESKETNNNKKRILWSGVQMKFAKHSQSINESLSDEKKQTRVSSWSCLN